MPARKVALPRAASLAICAIAVALDVTSPATGGPTIRVWKIGSPHTGETPPAIVPVTLKERAAKSGISIAVETFSANEFAPAFFDAVTRNAAPDLLVVNNFGLIDGITVGRAKYIGIAEEPTVRRDLVQVTGAFDSLLGPERGWTYLFSSSQNYEAARALALMAPACPRSVAASESSG